MKQTLLASFAVLGLIACSADPQAVETPEAETPVSVETNLSISDGYVMPPLKGRDVAAGFFTATNMGGPIAITAASSPLAQSVELHTHLMEDGIMKMREVEAIAIPEGESILFEPGSYHLMMFGFESDETQTTVPVTLTLDTGETLTVGLPIRER